MAQNNKILILGGSGYVGRNLFEASGPYRSVATYNAAPFPGGVYFDSLSMSLADIINAPEPFSHAVILIGDTKPDSCAADLRKSRDLNVVSIKAILDYLERQRIKPVFASTEVVFDGTKGNYVESDEVNPLLTYAMQKVEIEGHIQDCFEDFLILRLALVYGSNRGDGTVVTNWMQSIEDGQTSRCASDYIASPIYIGDAVEAILQLIDRGPNGIFHLSSHTALSRLQIYETLLAQVNVHGPVEMQPIPCSIHDFNTLEKRPLDVSMKPDKLVETIGIKLKSVEEVCRDVVREALQHQECG